MRERDLSMRGLAVGLPRCRASVGAVGCNFFVFRRVMYAFVERKFVSIPGGDTLTQVRISLLYLGLSVSG